MDVFLNFIQKIFLKRKNTFLKLIIRTITKNTTIKIVVFLKLLLNFKKLKYFLELSF